MTQAFWAYGSILQLGDAATPEVFTNIAEITDLAGLEMSRDKIVVTNHASPSGYHEKLPGMRDGGKISVKANWLPNNATQDEFSGILAKFNDDVLHNWKIIAPNSVVTVSFAAFVAKFKGGLPLDKQGELEFDLEISGKPVVS